jgi:hypothetical protein
MDAERVIERKGCIHNKGPLEVGLPSRAHADRRNEAPYRFSEGNKLVYTYKSTVYHCSEDLHSYRKKVRGAASAAE